MGKQEKPKKPLEFLSFLFEKYGEEYSKPLREIKVQLPYILCGFLLSILKKTMTPRNAREWIKTGFVAILLIVVLVKVLPLL
jgi:hypothetical protein